MENKELLLTACRNSQQFSSCLWDCSTGNNLHQYKNGGIAAPKTLTFIGQDYLISADEEKPLIHVWALNSQEPSKKLSTILPDKATTIAVSPDYTYLAMGIGMKLYIWHVSSGRLFAVQKKHFQPITLVKFSNDGVFVVVSGQDGMLLVYDLISLVNLHKSTLPQNEVGQVNPVFSKNDHSMPITDFHIGVFGHRSRVATVSLDNTCKIYELATGDMLVSLIFDDPLTSVVFDSPCWNLFVGTNTGNLQQFSLKEPPRPLEYHVNGSELLFKGHKNRITCLALATLTPILVSGSEDKIVYIWDISSRQILRSFEHKDTITNVQFVFNYENFITQNFKPRIVLKTLARELDNNHEFIESKTQNFNIELSDDENEDPENDLVRRLNEDILKLKATNKGLYDAAFKLCSKYNNVTK